MYYYFLLQNYRNIKKIFLKLKFYIKRIFTPESITLHENYLAKIMSRKALHSVLLHKSEVTYRDTGVSKNCYFEQYILYKLGSSLDR